MDDIDRTYWKLKRWSYGELQNTLLSKYDYLFMEDRDTKKVTWPEGAKEIIIESGWTEDELIKFVINR